MLEPFHQTHTDHLAKELLVQKIISPKDLFEIQKENLSHTKIIETSEWEHINTNQSNSLAFELLLEYFCYPLWSHDGVQYLATIDVSHQRLCEDLEFFSGKKFAPILANADDILEKLKSLKPEMPNMEFLISSHAQAEERHLEVEGTREVQTEAHLEAPEVFHVEAPVKAQEEVQAEAQEVVQAEAQEVVQAEAQEVVLSLIHI